jgi:heat-inducible transcriptional repressor
MVLVIVGGEIRQRLMTLPEPVPQEQLSAVAGHISRQFLDQGVEAIRLQRAGFSPLEQDVLDWVVEDLTQADSHVSGEIYLDGLTNVLSEPEFSGSEEARKALRVLEERSTLQDLLARTVLATGTVGGVQVIIGGEGTWDDLRNSSLVLGRYGVPGLATGTLGVLGPMRLAYGRTISTMRFLSGLLSDLVADTLTGED